MKCVTSQKTDEGNLNPLVAQRRDAVVVPCQAYRVQRLDLFGSATSESFDAAHSDLDFVVTFADCYLGFAEALKRMFQRKVDFVTERSIRNPYFRRAVEDTRQPVYDARREKASH